MKKTGIIIQARISSTRLPGKVMYELAGMPVLGIIIERLKRARRADMIILATGDKTENKPIVEVAKSFKIKAFVGPEDDVLRRFALAAQAFGIDTVVRVTADCPLADPGLVDEMVKVFFSGNYDYLTNVKPPTWPDGLDLSVFSCQVLDKADREAGLFSERQHVVPWMWKQVFDVKDPQFRGFNFAAPRDLSAHRWVIDEPEDYLFFRKIADSLGADGIISAGWEDVLRVIAEHPEIYSINRGIMRDEGLAQDILKDGKKCKQE